MEAGRRAGSCGEKSLASLSSHIHGLGVQPKADVSGCHQTPAHGPRASSDLPHVQPSRTSLAGLSGQSSYQSHQGGLRGLSGRA